MNKSPGLDGFTGKFYQTFRGVNTYPSETLEKIAEEGTLLNSFYEANITLMTKPDRTPQPNKRPASCLT